MFEKIIKLFLHTQKNEKLTDNTINELFFDGEETISDEEVTIKADGSLGGYASGTDKKIQLLEAEGVKIKNGKIG